MTPLEWAKCALVLRSSYTNTFKLDDAGLDVWFTLLQDIPGEMVLAAVSHMAKTQKAFPSVADIREHAEKAAGIRRNPLDAWSEALAKNHLLVWPISRGGETVGPEWSDPLIPRAIERIGGSMALAQMLTTEVPSFRARFVDAYEDLASGASRSATFAQMGALPENSHLPPARLRQLTSGIGKEVPGGA